MILMPLSSQDFDPTEAAIPARLLRQAGFQVCFATADGRPALPDSRMLDGKGLGICKPVLVARKDAVLACKEMMELSEYRNPRLYSDLRADDFDGLILHGGHAPGMRPYLESAELQRLIVDFMKQNKPVGAICHGVLLLARSRDESGTSVVRQRRLTCLLRKQEMAAYYMTGLWLGNYYRTYPETTTQDEVMSFLASPDQFQEGPTALARDSEGHLNRGFCVRDGNLVTARWPGDVYSFTHAFLDLLRR